MFLCDHLVKSDHAMPKPETGKNMLRNVGWSFRHFTKWKVRDTTDTWV